MALTRSVQPMPEDIAQRLDAAGQRDAYDRRPAYQRNDYLAWIGRAKQPQTRERRLTQMLDELARGGVYMRMDWRGGAGAETTDE